MPNLMPAGPAGDGQPADAWSPRTASPRSLAALLLAGSTLITTALRPGRPARAGPTRPTSRCTSTRSPSWPPRSTVFFGIKEISGRARPRPREPSPACCASSSTAGSSSAQTPLVRGLVLGILGAFAGGGVVIGTAQFYAESLGGGDAAFFLLFAMLFVGLGARHRGRPAAGRRAVPAALVRPVASCWPAAAVGPARARLPPVHRRWSARCWSASAPAWRSCPAPRCSAARSTTRCAAGSFAFVQTGTRVVLMLAHRAVQRAGRRSAARRELDRRRLVAFPVSTTRVLLLAAGVVRRPGRHRRVPADGRQAGRAGAGRPVGLAARAAARRRPSRSPAHGLFVVFEGGEGAGKSTQVRAARRGAARGRARRRGHPRAGRHRGRRADPRPAARRSGDAPLPPRAPRRCCTPPTGPTTWPPSSGRRWPAARW